MVENKPKIAQLDPVWEKIRSEAEQVLQDEPLLVLLYKIYYNIQK